MFFEPSKGDHGLPRNPFLALVAPRPIGWISTLSATGVPNLAPYSYFNALSSEPPVVAFSSTGAKHSMHNAAATGAFVVNIVSAPLAEAMNATSAEVDEAVDEFALAGLTAAPGKLVPVPRVAEARAAFECRHVRTIRITDAAGRELDSWLVIGEVVGIHLDEAVLTDGRVDAAKLEPVGRLGYLDYAVVRETFSMRRPPRP
jgi:flavin reductase (DIM6/NTAB) family NADH-FMN oxidoreductase RutF